MNCQPTNAVTGSDKLEVVFGTRSSNNSPNEWLIKQAVFYLNSTDQSAEVNYKNIVELLRRNEAAQTIVQEVRTTSKQDVNMQWNLLYILGDVTDLKSAGYLAEYALGALPERGEGCESPRDGEALLKTMAIQSLVKIVSQHANAADYLLRVVSQHPAQEVLVEAVKGAVETGHKEKVMEMLPKEDHWMIDLRKAKVDEVQADPERQDTKEVGYIPPKHQTEYTSPVMDCCCKKGETNHG